MGFSGQEGHVGFKTQVAEGAFLDPGAVSPNNGVFMRHLGGSLGANRELIIPDPEIGGNRDIPQAVLGPVSYSGDLECYFRFDAMATLFAAAFGASATTQDAPETDAHTHVITPLDDALTLPYLSIEEDIAGELDTYRYTDARVNTLSLECDPDGYLMGTVGLLAKTQLAGVTKTATPNVDTTPLVVGTSMAVDIGGVTTYITRNFSMDFNNNIEDDTFQLGQLGLADLTPKRRELSFGFTIRPTGVTAKNLWRQATYGATAATGPQSGAAFETSVNISIASFSLIGATATAYSLEIDVPSANVKPFRLEPSGDDVIEYDVEVQALRPTQGTPLATVTIINGTDAVL